MNQLILNTQKALRLSILLLVLIPATLLTRAAGNEPIENHPGSASTAEVRYVGTHEGDPLFNVLYTNSAGARFSVKVLDNEGHQLFQGVYTDRKFDKKFKVTDAQNYGKLTFIIRNFQDNSVQSFEINSVDRMVEDVEVKEVK
ncbi:MAG TPA: hypothetical protein VNS58_21795 [Puia sp.]|nr:hypothetical protein [Puia sp.]